MGNKEILDMINASGGSELVEIKPTTSGGVRASMVTTLDSGGKVRRNLIVLGNGRDEDGYDATKFHCQADRDGVRVVW
jgi:hypothetical protein